jgi:hypothetical protein
VVVASRLNALLTETITTSEEAYSRLRLEEAHSLYKLIRKDKEAYETNTEIRKS